MGALVPFPRIPLVNRQTPPGVEVILAPLASAWVAWIRLRDGRLVALENTPDRDHALRDAHAYADRLGIPVTVRSIPLACDGPDPALDQGGEIYVWVSPENGGSWSVEHVSRSGDASACIANAFSFDEAVTLAREAAQRLGATFDEGDAPGPVAA